MRPVPALRRRTPRILPLVSLMFLSASSLVQSISGQSASPPAPPPQPPSVDQEQFISYWTTETGWQSELELRNNTASSQLTVIPTLRTSNGIETSLAPVTLHPQEIKVVDLESAIIDSRAPQYVGTYGSVVLRYRSPSQGSLLPMLMVHNVGHSIAYHIDPVGEDQEVNPGSREGIWWLPNETATDYLLVTNVGSVALRADLSLYDSNGREFKQKIAIEPRTTNRLSVRQLVQAAGLSSTFGGIKILEQAHAGSLTSLHLLFDEKASFSALMKMFDYDPRTGLEERDYAHTNTWTMRAPMLALSHPDPSLAFPEGIALRPQLFVRNALAKPVNITLRFTWRNAGASGKAVGPAFKLGPYETRRIDVGALQNANLLPRDANWASVVLTTDGLPNEVVAVATSYDESLRYGAQTPFSDQLAFQWVGSLWQYDAQHNSLITAGNGGTKPVQARLSINYNQGNKKYELEQLLQPDEQMWVDVGKLIREHAPDKNGNVLPGDLGSGSYEIRDLTDKFVGSLFEGKIVYDKTYGHVTYGCGGCCGYTQSKLWYDPLGIPFQGSAPSGVFAYTNCSSSWDDVSGAFDGKWSTANSSVATVDYYAHHQGVAVGSTTSSTSAYLEHATQHGQTCPLLNFAPSGGDNVGPNKVEPISTTIQGAAICPAGQQGWSRTVQNQLEYFNGSPYKVAGINMADSVLVGSRNDLRITNTQTGAHSTDSYGTFPDTYFVCSPVCPNSVAETDALQSWTYDKKPLAHVNTVVYKCSSISVDGF